MGLTDRESWPSTALTRREFLKTSVGAAALGVVWASGCARWVPRSTGGVLVNDVHAQLNPTRVRRILRLGSVDDAQRAIRQAAREGASLCIAGARHAMGGQQFGTDALLADMTAMDRVLAFDRRRGEVEVEAGITWPQLIDHLVAAQQGDPVPWGIIQKQTGANHLTLGGALASNIHSRGLRMKPIIDNVEAFTLVDANGRVRRCSRQEEPELFRLAIGGYGLFGLITSIRLRLGPRRQVERLVDVRRVDELMDAFDRRIAGGCLYGDFQYAIDPDSDDFLDRGILSCYRPVDAETPIPAHQQELSVDDWRELVYLAHVEPGRAFERYTRHYLGTNGQRYWSDTHQLSTYLENYHQWLDAKLSASAPATEVITEIYVPRDILPRFLSDVREDFRRHRVRLIYGTIRLIERDDESFLAWAKESYACIIFNLHTVHTPEGLARSTEDFRRLIDRAIAHGGSYYLTYHRFATRRQVEACYPQFAEFLRLKRRYDPPERFQSDWYRHYRTMFQEVLA